MINYDPEEYKEATSMELSIQHVHDGTTKLSICPTLLQDSPSPKGEALFNKHNHGPPKESRCLPGRSFWLIPLRSSGCSYDLES